MKNFKHNICKNHEFGEYCITPTDFRLHNFNIGKTFSEELKIPLEAFRGESTWTGETTRLLSSSPTSP
ncbi:hypothetical protein IJM86_06670 [bacterium]|nr:hypothetical protein [bacterium]